MVPVSIVIITRNEAEIIEKCLEMARLISDDIVVIDHGSTDGTPDLAARNDCRVYQKKWDGYGANKNKGIALARHDWILSLDADEIPDQSLVRALFELDLSDPHHVYDIRFRSYFGQKRIRFGTWGRDHHIRLFNRKMVRWAESEVHETLLLPADIRRKKLPGFLHHYAVKNVQECGKKAEHYAILSARQYFATGKKATFVKMYLSPLFVFAKNYLFLLGFLDGAEGLHIARMMFKNTRLKYAFLQQYQGGRLPDRAAENRRKNVALEI